MLGTYGIPDKMDILRVHTKRKSESTPAKDDFEDYMSPQSSSEEEEKKSPTYVPSKTSVGLQWCSSQVMGGIHGSKAGAIVFIMHEDGDEDDGYTESVKPTKKKKKQQKKKVSLKDTMKLLGAEEELERSPVDNIVNVLNEERPMENISTLKVPEDERKI
nr:hypothetical protein BaRGS_025000 [Batillaria attramentaria]